MKKKGLVLIGLLLLAIIMGLWTYNKYLDQKLKLQQSKLVQPAITEIKEESKIDTEKEKMKAELEALKQKEESEKKKLDEEKKKEQERLDQLQSKEYINSVVKKIRNYNGFEIYEKEIKQGKLMWQTTKVFKANYYFEWDIDWKKVEFLVAKDKIVVRGIIKENLYLKPIALQSYDIDFAKQESGMFAKNKKIELDEDEIKALLVEAEKDTTDKIQLNSNYIHMALKHHQLEAENMFLKSGYGQVVIE